MDSSGDDPTAAAVAWLLSSNEPAIRYLTRRELLDDRDGAAAAADAAQILEGPKTRALLAGQQPDGGFGVHPYSKWTGAHWRLVSLVELAAPIEEPRLQAAASTVLDWLTSRSHRRRVQVIDGLTRRCASQEGNALAVACRLGRAGDPRAELLARSLVDWQWPDGGWNCDLRASGRRSSFHESLPPAWGLHEYWLATGATWAQQAAAQAAQLTHAYAVSIHRSQGSEYPCVVVPVTTSAWLMLQRNLLYTAVTRAKQMVVLVGSRRALAKAVRTQSAGRDHPIGGQRPIGLVGRQPERCKVEGQLNLDPAPNADRPAEPVPSPETATKRC